MDKYFQPILSTLSMLLALSISWFAAVKAFVWYKQEETKKAQIEADLKLSLSKEETKQKEIEARENSLGKEAVTFLKAEIAELQKAKSEGIIKFDKIESVIQQLEMMIQFIERRMLNDFPDKK